MVAPRSSEGERVPALDGLRGIAILMVMAQHFIPLNSSSRGDQVLRLFPASGWAGVDLFFVLSGLLITGILLDVKDRGRVLRPFYARRALRILPAFSAVMILMVGVAWAFPELDPRGFRTFLATQFWHWTFLTNVRIAIDGSWDRFAFTGHLWSLGVEEQFYLVWPAIVLILSNQKLAIVAAASVPLALVFRAVLVFGNSPVIGTLVSSPAKMDELTLGGLLALAMRDAGIRAQLAPVMASTRLTMIALGTFVVASVATTAMGVPGAIGPSAMWGFTVGQSFVAIGAALVVASAVGANAPTPFVNLCELSWLRRVGKYSYALYLVHYPLNKIAHRLGASPDTYRSVIPSHVLADVAYALTLTLASLVLAAISWHFLENPVLRLRSRFPYGGPRFSGGASPVVETGVATT